MTTKTTVGLIGVLVFLLGAGYLVYMGRPVMKLPPQTQTPVIVTTSTIPTPTAISTTETVATTTPAKPGETKTEPKTPSVPAPTPTPKPVPTPTPAPTPAPNTFTMSDVRAHSSSASCWSVINGNVYDLTSWISRHPGGEEAIIELCGIDGTAAYTDQHDSSRRPASALVLLKIGTLR